jgi:DNA-binding protein HU-beta
LAKSKKFKLINIKFQEEFIMTKSELIKKIKENGDYTNVKDAEKALNIVLDTIKDTLATGEKVQIVGFGTFEVRQRAEKKAINPRTKVEYVQPAKKAPAFKAGKSLKEIVNN